MLPGHQGSHCHGELFLNQKMQIRAPLQACGALRPHSNRSPRLLGRAALLRSNPVQPNWRNHARAIARRQPAGSISCAYSILIPRLLQARSSSIERSLNVGKSRLIARVVTRILIGVRLQRTSMGKTGTRDPDWTPRILDALAQFRVRQRFSSSAKRRSPQPHLSGACFVTCNW